jgi:hypothetical protein
MLPLGLRPYRQVDGQEPGRGVLRGGDEHIGVLDLARFDRPLAPVAADHVGPPVDKTNEPLERTDVHALEIDEVSVRFLEHDGWVDGRTAAFQPFTLGPKAAPYGHLYEGFDLDSERVPAASITAYGEGRMPRSIRTSAPTTATRRPRSPASSSTGCSDDSCQPLRWR